MADHDPFRPPPDDDLGPENPYAPPESELVGGPRGLPRKPGGMPFEVGLIVEQAWALYKQKFGLVFGLVNVPIWINMLYQLAGRRMADTVDQESTMGILANFMFLAAGVVMQIWLTSGTSLALIKLVRGEEAEVGDIFHGGPFVPRILGASLLYTFAALVLVAGCLVPAGIMGYAGNQVGMVVGGIVGLMIAMALALFLAARFNQFSYLVIDRDARPVESLRGSYEITRGHTFEVLGLILIGVAVGLAGFLACIVGYFFTVPWTMLLFVCAYVALIGERPSALDKAEDLDSDFGLRDGA